MLSGAVLRVFIPGLLALFVALSYSIVAADPDPASIQMLQDRHANSAQCGNVSVSWTVAPSQFGPGAGQATLRIVNASGKQAEFSPPMDQGESFFPEWCGDILGDGSQALAYDIFTGGSHCCFKATVMLLDDSRRTLFERALGNTILGPPQQLGTGGPLQLVTQADMFAYFYDLAFVNTPYVPLIFVYDGTTYVEATRRFPDYLASEVIKSEADLASMQGHKAVDQEQLALRLYALHILLGDVDQALPGIKAKVPPAVAAWLEAHAAEARTRLAMVYDLSSDTVAMHAIPETASVQSRSPDAAVPGALTDAIRQDVLAAVNRANDAWAKASETLDASVLNDALAGQELADDIAAIDKLQGQGQTRKNVNTAFAVADVTLDGPGLATVRTRETWYAEIYDAASGQLQQRTAASTYNKTYTVEFTNGGWIVTKNDLS